jgi:hypothetical protein
MNKNLIMLLSVGLLLTSCGENQPKITEPAGDNRTHYDFLIKECATNEKLIEESGYTKSASQLGRRSYCTEAEEMRERITGILDSTAPGAKNF